MKMKQKTNRYLKVFLIAIIIILISGLGYLLYQQYQLTKILDNYPEIIYNEIIHEDVDSQILKNIDAMANEEIGYIEIPRLNMKAPLLQAESNENPYGALDNTVAHDPQTPLPGEGIDINNSVYLGHREEQFSKLENVEIGDLIVINSNNNTFLYEVDDAYEVDYYEGDLTPEQELINQESVNNVFKETENESITLYTCYPFTPMSFIKGRYIVRAHRVEQFEKNW